MSDEILLFKNQLENSFDKSLEKEMLTNLQD